jgi:hypothetical protein
MPEAKRQSIELHFGWGLSYLSLELMTAEFGCIKSETKPKRAEHGGERLTA